MASTHPAEHAALRQLIPEWNKAMIAASIAISFLGAFTSTQLMCHARMSARFSGVLLWSVLGSMIFGFCSIWSLHEVAMLALEYDVKISVDPLLTVLSSVLAVAFTFVALATDLLWDRYHNQTRWRRKKSRKVKGSKIRPQPIKFSSQSSIPAIADTSTPDFELDRTPLLTVDESEGEEPINEFHSHAKGSNQFRELFPPLVRGVEIYHSPSVSSLGEDTLAVSRSNLARDCSFDHTAPSAISDDETGTSTDNSFRHSAGSSSLGLGSAMETIYYRRALPAGNALIGAAKQVYVGLSCRNLAKGFFWSLAITGMHYVGLYGLIVPSGYVTFNTELVLLSALISWTVCVVGSILMSNMETHLGLQILFSVIAAAGVAAMHFTGMYATTFWSSAPPSDSRGYPPALANAVVAIAFVTCIAANVLLAHSATVSRNKLAEIVSTRKELWKTIAQKENAEASARARSDFIASASHEIRTPLHHLQGYSDLLAHTELTEEGRSLLRSIQRATKTLSLITNNVLDWSKFERDSETSYRPTALDIRAVCESIIVLLPNIEDESRVQLFVAVAPNVPKSIFLDEIYIHRILMNLLSNAMKFTRAGYILLLIEINGDNLVATVRDTGCGLDPTFIPDMWMPFKQGEVRGSARGTGLGLSIIKRLLARMKGTIEVESEYMHSEDVGPENSGTTFTVTIPLLSTMDRLEISSTEDSPRVAILSASNTRSTEGFQTCWQAFGFEVELVPDVTALAKSKWKYVWADLEFLQQEPIQFNQLLQRKKYLVLVPYDTHDSLEGLPGILSAPNFVMLQKPLMWHAFDRRILASKSRRQSAGTLQALRFATEVEVMDSEVNEQRKEEPSEEAAKTKSVVLVVEDNVINRKLATKMLLNLGYEVLTADDGVEAIDQMIKYDRNVDAILMDQSMPRKDGITTTRELRELEAFGKLSRRTPIIAVTAVVNSAAQGSFQDAGADDFLAKPLSLDKLRDTLVLYLPRD